MMAYNSIKDLKDIIVSELSPIIGLKCALFDAPYYKNIGDVLIWQGELSLLKELSREIVYTCSDKSCQFPNLSKDISILFQGGGNIGDLYINHTQFLSEIIERYPNNRIIVFPQTAYFRDSTLEVEYLTKIANHKDIYFCCRDYKSFETVNKYFGNRTLLLPDMAFCINPIDLYQFRYQVCRESLFIKREDIEKLESNIKLKFDKISDWPTFKGKIDSSIVVNTILDRICPITKSNNLCKLWDKFAINHFRWSMIKTGVNFISPYKKIYSERLHGVILSIILDKEVVIVDNSYGKNSTFYDTWLMHLPNVKIIGQPQN